MPKPFSTAWWKKYKSTMMLCGLVAGILAASYPIMVQPYFNPEGWRDMQSSARAGEDRAKMQPGGMKVWSDPFDRKK